MHGFLEFVSNESMESCEAVERKVRLSSFEISGNLKYELLAE